MIISKIKCVFFAFAVMFCILSNSFSAQIDVAVFDFLTPAVSIRSYQETRVANPLSTRPEPMLSPEQIEKLPEVDRLAAYRREQMALEKWQEEKRRIEVESYNDFTEQNKKVRDQLLVSQYGRSVVNATSMMESELSKFPASFRIFGRRGGGDAQRDLNIESEIMGGLGPSVGAAPTHFVEGKLGDLIKRDSTMADGPTSISVRSHMLPVTITLYELANRQVVSTYSEDVKLVDRVRGSNFKGDAEVMQELLRSATTKAAEKFSEDLQPK